MPEEKPIPLDFYDKDAWFQTIVDFYGNKPKFLPSDILSAPVKMLTSSVAAAIDVYGNFPIAQTEFLELTIDPLYEIGEYKNVSYKAIIDDSIRLDKPNYKYMADNLLNIRNLFEKDKPFLLANFKNEISHMPDGSDDAKFLHFAEVIRNITKIHINQINEIIRSDFVVG